MTKIKISRSSVTVTFISFIVNLKECFDTNLNYSQKTYKLQYLGTAHVYLLHIKTGSHLRVSNSRTYSHSIGYCDMGVKGPRSWTEKSVITLAILYTSHESFTEKSISASLHDLSIETHV
jgi:hypothetical protein